jgi:hypothetical protein
MPENNIGKTMCHHINVFSQKLTRWMSINSLWPGWI